MCSVSNIPDNKIYKPVIIAEKDIVALLDTASDINVIRVEQYVKLGSPPLTGSNIRYKGVGSEIFTTLGSFRAEIKINDDIFKLLIHVIPNACFEYDLLIGSDLLTEARILVEGSNARVSKREREVEVTSDTAEISRINVVDEIEDSEAIFEYQKDIQSIKDAVVRQEIQNLVHSYKPKATKTVNIKTEIILKDDALVYQTPCRLAPVNRKKS